MEPVAYGEIVESQEPYVQTYKPPRCYTLQIISMINYSLNQNLYIKPQQLLKAGSLPSTLRKFASPKLYCSSGDLIMHVTMKANAVHMHSALLLTSSGRVGGIRRKLCKYCLKNADVFGKGCNEMARWFNI